MRLDESVQERFESKFESVNTVDDIKGDCWEWTCMTHSYGYGRFSIDSKWYLGHRISYRLYKGEIPDDKYVLHKCHNACCVNPEHLYLGSQKDNVQDAVSQGNFEDRKNGDVSGEINGRSKLTKDDVREIRKKYEETNISYSDLAEQYGISFGTVGKIIRRERWQHVD